MSAPTAALYYATDGFDTSRPKLMGRHAAGEGFLTAMVRHSGFDRLVALVPTAADANGFAQQVTALGGTMPTQAILETDLHKLAETGALMLPGPGLGPHAWRRRRLGQGRFSLIGLTHTTASAGAMDNIADLLTAPVQPWDALICTSRAVAAMVGRLLAAEGDYLSRRLGATRLALPPRPVIPLGVDVPAFAPDPAARAGWRAQLGLAPQDVLVLHHGRLSFHAKAHPAPMFAALAAAAGAAPAGARVHLLLSGWFADDHQRNAFLAMARHFAPGLPVHHVDGRQKAVRAGIWSAADIFTLLSDNIQETFGLAPVEAMAAGLPVVGTDWDGLRDTIVHGETGFLVPTLMAGPMADLAARHEAGTDSYDSYIAGAMQFTAVDVPAATAAFAALIADPGRRAAMGAAGHARARATFDWAPILGQYRALWAELATIRNRGQGEVAAPLPGEERVPRRADPSRIFADYPTRRLTPETRLALPPGIGAAETLARIGTLVGVAGALPRADLLPAQDALAEALAVLEQGPTTAGHLAASLPAARAARLHRALAWLLKMDLLRLAP